MAQSRESLSRIGIESVTSRSDPWGWIGWCRFQGSRETPASQLPAGRAAPERSPSWKHRFGNTEAQRAPSCCPGVSCITFQGYPTSALCPPTSALRPLPSDLCPPTSDLRPPTSGPRPPAPSSGSDFGQVLADGMQCSGGHAAQSDLLMQLWESLAGRLLQLFQSRKELLERVAELLGGVR